MPADGTPALLELELDQGGLDSNKHHGQPRERGFTLLHSLLLAVALLLSAAVFGGAGFAIGYTVNGHRESGEGGAGVGESSASSGSGAQFVPALTPHAQQPPQPIDIDLELRVIERVCDSDELHGSSDDPPSEACLALLEEKVAALDALVHGGRNSTTEPGATEPEPETEAGPKSRRRRGSSGKCDGDWSGTCCYNNRPGPLTGPSPICRVIMKSKSSKGWYECSWWNGFCWALCYDYDEVKYCGYFDN